MKATLKHLPSCSSVLVYLKPSANSLFCFSPTTLFFILRLLKKLKIVMSVTPCPITMSRSLPDFSLYY